MYFFNKKNLVIQAKGGIEYADKTDAAKGGGRVGQMMTRADEGGRGVGEMLTLADKEGRGVWTPSFLADIICEQPLIEEENLSSRTILSVTLLPCG